MGPELEFYCYLGLFLTHLAWAVYNLVYKILIKLPTWNLNMSNA